MKNQVFNICIVLITVSLLISGCAQQAENAENIEEKAPPNVIQLSSEATQSSGLSSVLVENKNVSSQITTTAEIKADENSTFHINSFTSGRALQDNVLLGQSVRQGQTLAVIQNLDAAKVQADYIHQLHQNEIDIDKAKTQYSLARKNLEREKKLWQEGISPRRDFQQAEADTEIARTELSGQQEHKLHIKAEGKALLGAYGISPGSVHTEKIRTGSPITAPRAGIITQKNITLGDMVTSDSPMYEVSDLSKLWLDITIYPKDIAKLKVGQAVKFSTDSLPGKVFEGKVDYLQPITNETSQTYIARAYLKNPNFLLKPGMLGQAKLEQEANIDKPFIPENAVQKYGRETFVFIPLKNNQYKKQAVQLGNQVEGGYIVESGLEAGQRIITKGSFILKAEMLKGQFEEEE